MKAFGALPTEERVKQMNDAQWLWCYHNLVQDKEEENLDWKYRLTYLGSYMNPEHAMNVMREEENRQRNKSKGNKKEKYKKKYKSDYTQNDDFEKQMKAAMMGYNPNSGMSIDEFLSKSTNVEDMVAQDSQEEGFDLDSLVDQGKFAVIQNEDGSYGNKYETEEEFIDRSIEVVENIGDIFNFLQQIKGSSQSQNDLQKDPISTFADNVPVIDPNIEINEYPDQTPQNIAHQDIITRPTEDKSNLFDIDLDNIDEKTLKRLEAEGYGFSIIETDD